MELVGSFKFSLSPPIDSILGQLNPVHISFLHDKATSLCLIKHHIVKACVEVGVQLHTLTPALDE
jgi:hypothetical protein